MRRRCSDCDLTYDDARCSTICPHTEFLSEVELAQKDAGIRLLGKRVQFRSNPLPTGPHRVWAVGWTGLLSLDGLDGEFAPHLVEVVE